MTLHAPVATKHHAPSSMGVHVELRTHHLTPIAILVFLHANHGHWPPPQPACASVSGWGSASARPHPSDYREAMGMARMTVRWGLRGHSVWRRPRTRLQTEGSIRTVRATNGESERLRCRPVPRQSRPHFRAGNARVLACAHMWMRLHTCGWTQGSTRGRPSKRAVAGLHG